MSVVIWIILGAIVGLFATRMLGEQFPLRTAGAIVTGALGGFLGGGIVAAIGSRTVSGFDLLSAVTALVGAALLIAVLRQFGHAEPRAPSAGAQ